MSIDHSTSAIKSNSVIDAPLSDMGAPENRNSLAPPTARDTAIIAAASARKASLYADQHRRPDVLAINWDGIPAALRALPQWVGWETRWRDSSWSKVLVKATYYPSGWRAAKSNDPTTWTTFERVRKMWDAKGKTTHTLGKGAVTLPDPAGPGFVFAAGGGIVGIDLDKCRDPLTGELTSLAQRLVHDLRGYWEVSPSGTGIKGFFFGSLPDGWKGKKRELDSGEEVEVYDQRRYFAVTGHRLADATADLTSCADQLPAFLAEFVPTLPPRPARAPRTTTSSPSSSDRTVRVDPSTVGRDERMRRARAYLREVEGAVEKQGGDKRTYRVACVLVLGFGLDIGDAFDVFGEWNLICLPLWNEHGMYRKLEYADRESGPRCYLLEWERARGYENLTVEECTALAAEPPAPAPTEECKYTVADEISEMLAWRRCTKCTWRGVENTATGAEGNAELGCHDPNCAECLSQSVHAAFRTDKPFMLGMTDADNLDRQRLDALVVEPAQEEAVKKAIARAGARYREVKTTDGNGCAALLQAADAPLSSLVQEKNQDVEGVCTSEDNTSEGEIRTLFLILSPLDKPPIRGRVVKGQPSYAATPITVASGFRALGNAYQSVPRAPEGVGRFARWSRSLDGRDMRKKGEPLYEHDPSTDRKWGDDAPKEKSDLRFTSKAIITGSQTEAIAKEIGWSIAFHTESKQVQGKVAGFRGPTAAHTLALRVLICGLDAPGDTPPTFATIRGIAKQLDNLIPLGLGKGREVEMVLRKRLWNPPTLYPEHMGKELREADQLDKKDAVSRADFAEAVRALPPIAEGVRLSLLA